MKTRFFYFLLAMSALALAGCGHDASFDEPEPQVYTAENDPALEKLRENVGYYYGDKDGDNLKRFEFAYRAAGQYCIFPVTKKREQRLEELARQEGAQVQKVNDFYLVTRDRNFITGDDYVSDMYFTQYYNGEPDYLIIGPRITVCVPDPKTKDKILSAYFGKLIESNDSEQGHVNASGHYLYRFVCNLKNSKEVMNLADKLYRRNDVKWAQASFYMKIHY